MLLISSIMLTVLLNYQEVFDRNVGKDSALKIARGQNALWNQGGIQYAPPVR